MLAATTWIQARVDTCAVSFPRGTRVAGGVLIVFSLRWPHFDESPRGLLSSNRVGFLWGYGHLPIFAAVAAVGAGLGVAADDASCVPPRAPSTGGWAVGVPVAVFPVFLWLVQARLRRRGGLHHASFPVTAALVLTASSLPGAVLWIGLLLASLAAVVSLTRA